MKKIPLTKGEFALVDDDDFENLHCHRWLCVIQKTVKYARRLVSVNGQWRWRHMHREVVKTPKNLDVDHINGNGLDNRKINLRKCSRSCNCANSKFRNNNTSGFRGVTFDRHRKRWKGQIMVKGKNIFLGRFLTAVSAAQSYNQAALKFFGEFARLNKI